MVNEMSVSIIYHSPFTIYHATIFSLPNPQFLIPNPCLSFPPIIRYAKVVACFNGHSNGWGITVDFAMTPGGLLVHSCENWPCAVCRPSLISESRAYCLCLHCANAIVVAASAGEPDARALLDEISDALSLLAAQQYELRLPAD